ncbi:MAG TPA: hypothetical protein VF444_07110 [Pseudonocardiaceae bacterium]
MEKQIPPAAPRRGLGVTVLLFVLGLWYFVITIGSAGMLAAAPFFQAWEVLRDRAAWRLGWIYAGISLIVLNLFIWPPNDAVGDNLRALAFFLMIVETTAACIQQNPLRRRVLRDIRSDLDGSPEAADTEAGAGPTVDPAVAALLAAQEHRDQARAMVARNPQLARVLRIGRPDLDSNYNDGGLVDLNSAPATVIAIVCDIDMASAQRIVDVRDRQGGSFSSVYEVLVLAEPPYPAWDRIRERAILLG